jgi:hypothetical protein
MRRFKATGQILDFHYKRGVTRKRIERIKKKCMQNPELEVCRELSQQSLL